jgi:probable phosphoglycerate mutase
LRSVSKSLNNENVYLWDTLEVGIKSLTNQVKQSLYKPTLLVGIGRGGAVMSALLSGTLGDRPPFIALEREYDWKEKKRTAKIFDDVKFSKNLDRVLLVAGDVVTGGTADLFTEYLKKLGAKEIRLLTFLKVKSTTKIPDFFYIDSNSSDFTLPWMLNEDYLRDSREIYKLK